MSRYRDHWVFPLPPNSKRGYTLAELLVVCGIISILAAISFALIGRMRTQVVETNALGALDSFATGYEMYYYHYLEYPQWGLDEEFQSPKELVDFMVTEDYLPGYFRAIEDGSQDEYDESTGYLFGITQDYAVEIVEFNPYDPTTSRASTYFIIFHPYNFQRDLLAIGTNPDSGWVAVRPRRGPEGTDFRLFNLFVSRRGGAED